MTPEQRERRWRASQRLAVHLNVTATGVEYPFDSIRVHCPHDDGTYSVEIADGTYLTGTPVELLRFSAAVAGVAQRLIEEGP